MGQEKVEASIVTVGWDDTLKKERTDCGTGFVNVVDRYKKRTIISLGFQQDISHMEEDSAESLKSTVTKLAKATSSIYQDALSCFDFYMTDRTRDSDKMLECLNVNEEKGDKCNAHPTLSVEQDIDKVFSDVESPIGIKNLFLLEQ